MSDLCRNCRTEIDEDADHADKSYCKVCYKLAVKRAADSVDSI